MNMDRVTTYKVDLGLLDDAAYVYSVGNIVLGVLGVILMIIFILFFMYIVSLPVTTPSQVA